MAGLTTENNLKLQKEIQINFAQYIYKQLKKKYLILSCHFSSGGAGKAT